MGLKELELKFKSTEREYRSTLKEIEKKSECIKEIKERLAMGYEDPLLTRINKGKLYFKHDFRYFWRK